ncbi:MAG: DsrE family protein [Hyphomicrobiaceae bacterium]|nr:DsrE family protein [Hyphomicrobiaceae bacterium]
MSKLTQLALAVVAAFTLAFAAPVQQAVAKDKIHHVAFHVNQKDKAVMNLALNNVQNLINYYKKKGEKIVVEVVTYGPGLHMLRADTSPVKDRIASISLTYPSVRFSACGNTHAKMAKAAGKPIKLVSEATRVPSGVVRLVELQEQGYRYIRP